MMNAKERKEYNEQKQAQYPLGTVLWCMSGKPHHGKVYWSPMARSIEQHPEKGVFMFDPVPMTHGSTWNNIGRSYFLSREECLAAWGEKPLITDDDCPVEEQEHPAPEEYGKQIIRRNDGNTLLYITVGLNRNLYPLYKLTWNIDKEMERMMGDGGYLTLDEIRSQIYAESGEQIIEVREETPLNGVIHQTGNYNDGFWREQGITRGYA